DQRVAGSLQEAQRVRGPRKQLQVLEPVKITNIDVQRAVAIQKYGALHAQDPGPKTQDLKTQDPGLKTQDLIWPRTRLERRFVSYICDRSDTLEAYMVGRTRRG